MTRKDFQLIADTFAEQTAVALAMHEEIGAKALGHFADAMADALSRTNPRFDRERFLAACEPRA